jgi:hypothetical protein
MKLYRAKVPMIAQECIGRLSDDGDIELVEGKRSEAEQDLVAIMEEYLRRDFELREQIKDHMADGEIPYGRFGRIRSEMAEERGHPLGDDVERYLVRQFVENLMISPAIEEVFEEDKVIYKKLMEVVKGHDVDEDALREEAKDKIKNVREGTVDYEIAMRNAIRDVKKRKGLI